MAEEVKKFQSENKVEMQGVLVSLEVEDKMTSTNVPMKMGTMKVRTGEGEVHTLRLMQMKYFKNDKNNENKQYKALETIEAEYVSEEMTKDSSSEHFGKTPTVVFVIGRLEPNVFKTRGGEVVETVNISPNFISRANDPDPELFKATLRFSGFVEANPIPEVDKDDEETGRYKLKVRGIDFQNKAFPVELVAGKIQLSEEEDDVLDAGAWIEENFERGQTVVVDADIVNKYIIKEVKRNAQGGMGNMVDTQRDVQRENVIFAALDPIDFDEFDEDEPAHHAQVVFPSQMEESMKNYETYKNERIAAAENNKKKSGSGSGSASRGAFGSGESKKKKKSNDDLASQLPF